MQLLSLTALSGAGFGDSSEAFLDGVFPSVDPAVGGSQPPALLSEVGAFRDLENLEPVDSLVPYEVNTPLWSDGAVKQRWLSIPSDGVRDSEAERIVFDLEQPWTLPAGAVAVKHFALPLDESDPSILRPLETRFLVALGGGDFYGVTYRWREDGTEADLVVTAVSDEIEVRAAEGSLRTQTWEYPTQNDCRFCHNQGAGVFLGLRTWQMNLAIDGEEGAANQITQWAQDGLFTNLTGDEADWPRGVSVDDPEASLELRSKSYLAANCANCHNENDLLGTSFALDFHVPFDEADLINATPLYDLGITGAEVVKPGEPEASILCVRMETSDVHRMPPIGRSLVDQEAAETVDAWILTLKNADGTGTAPVANDDEARTLSGRAVTIPVFANDWDEDEQTFSVINHGEPAYGSVTWSDQGATYTPPAAFVGEVTFRYQLVDSTGLVSEDAVVTVKVSNQPSRGEVAFIDGSALLANPSSASGVAMGAADMNQDGLDDIIHFQEGTRLFIDYQQEDGSFQTEEVDAFQGKQWGMAIGDTDNNGFPDIITGGYYDGLFYYRDSGTGSGFTLTRHKTPLIFMQALNLVDIDNDGWLDVFACNDDADNAKMRNQGDGTIKQDGQLIDTAVDPVSQSSGNYGSTWTDYNGDGLLDLYLSKCKAIVQDPTDLRRVNRLYRGNADGSFTEVAAEAGLADGSQSWATDFADIDNDGDLDCFIGNHMAPSLMMQNQGDGTFREVTVESGVTVDWKVIQVVFRDFNLDGWVDLLLVGEEHQLWLNDGDGTFTEAENPFTAQWIESCVVGDFNDDGHDDVYAGYAALYNQAQLDKPDKLFLSVPNGNNHLAVTLQGRESNRLASGARIELHGPWGIQVREVRSGEGYGVTHSFTQRFGLGAEASADRLVIRWPSGIVDIFTDIVANQTLLIEEGDSEPPVLAAISDRQSRVGDFGSLQLEGSDPFQSTLQYSASDLPPGLVLDPDTGLISGELAVPGDYEVTVGVSDGWSVVTRTFTWRVLSDQQLPFAGEPQALPGRVEAENYDWGGEGLAYHDAEEENLTGSYRDESVDIEESGDNDGSYSLSWFDAGEWLEYTVDIQPGIYEVTVRTAAGVSDPGELLLALDGEALVSFDTPDTGASNSWSSTVKKGIWIPEGGVKVLRVEALGDGINLNWIDFTRPANLAGENAEVAWQAAFGGDGPGWQVHEGVFAGPDSPVVGFTALSGGAWRAEGYVKDGLLYQVQCSTDLQSWDVPYAVIGDDDGGAGLAAGYEPIYLRTLEPQEKAFFRVELRQAP
ncbi:MAG: FG-GAP-like repeat-containing protein [Verrucomicrobiota bacterium JB023]|nr:FG-GAP-like repeat-containing protein [Verrucomicrobiota bacterium JB023]